MSSLMHLVVENYNEIIESKKDPTVDSWPLMKSPLPTVLILVGYLYFVLDLGPRIMKKRKPMELTTLLIIYNAYQVLFSVWLVARAYHVPNPFQHIMTRSCVNPTSNSPYKMILVSSVWWYFFAKITELLDTVFFVLRKKQSQVTFLHVYHHTIMVFFTWGYLKFLPAEQGVFIGFVNSLVHVVMYTYYLLSALGPKYQKYLWWKKYMTWIQLIQFCIMLVYLTGLLVVDCKLPKALTFFFFGNVAIFLYLFANYYRKEYNKPRKPEANGEITTSQQLNGKEIKVN